MRLHDPKAERRLVKAVLDRVPHLEVFDGHALFRTVAAKVVLLALLLVLPLVFRRFQIGPETETIAGQLHFVVGYWTLVGAWWLHLLFVSRLFRVGAFWFLPFSGRQRVHFAARQMLLWTWLPLIQLGTVALLLYFHHGIWSGTTETVLRVIACWLGMYGLAVAWVKWTNLVPQRVTHTLGALLFGMFVFIAVGKSVAHHFAHHNEAIRLLSCWMPGTLLTAKPGEWLPWLVCSAWIIIGVYAWRQLTISLPDFMDQDRDLISTDDASAEPPQPTVEPSRQGWIEALIQRYLNSQQRAIYATFGPQKPHFTRNWYLSIANALWVLPLLWLIRGIDLPDHLGQFRFIAFIWLALLLWSTSNSFGYELPDAVKPLRQGKLTSIRPFHFPVLIADLVATNFRVSIVRAAVGTPLILMLGVGVLRIFEWDIAAFWLHPLLLGWFGPSIAHAWTGLATIQFTGTTSKFVSQTKGTLFWLGYTGASMLCFFVLAQWLSSELKIGFSSSLFPFYWLAVAHLWSRFVWLVLDWDIHRRGQAWIRPAFPADAR